LRQLIIGHYGWWNLWTIAGPASKRVPAELDSLANAARVKVPAIFISAGADVAVPAKYHRMVIDAYAGPKRVIEMPDGGHDSPLTREAAEELGKDMDWLWGAGMESSTRPSPQPPQPSPGVPGEGANSAGAGSRLAPENK
jgi:hypothetical protein